MKRQTLSIIVNPHTYQRLQREVGRGKISQFVEQLIVKGLDNHEEKLAVEQKNFEQKLIADYQRESSQTPDEEDKM
jgi:hypothetical protein